MDMLVITIALAAFCTCGGFLIIRIARWKEGNGELRCGHCGYILFGATSGNCPECGSPVTDAKPTQIPSFPHGPRAMAGCVGVCLLAVGLFFVVFALLLIWETVILGIKTGT